MNRKLNAYTIYLILAGSFSIFFTMMAMISAIYRVETAGLNPLQLVLVGTVLEASVFLFEIPTGIVADLKSRKLSVVIGYFLIGLGFMLEGAFPVFGVILLARDTRHVRLTSAGSAFLRRARRKPQRSPETAVGSEPSELRTGRVRACRDRSGSRRRRGLCRSNGCWRACLQPGRSLRYRFEPPGAFLGAWLQHASAR